MSAYCAICQYPAPCGRDHGEDEHGNDIHPVYRPPEPKVWIGGDPLGYGNMPTEWRCTHCDEAFVLREAQAHMDSKHPDCLWCSSEQLLIAGILDWEARHPEQSAVQ